MKKLLFSFLLLATASTLASAQGYGDRNRPAGGGGSYNIFVKVLLPDGKPAMGASVSVTTAEVGASGTGTTDPSGTYTFSGMPAGSYHFIAKVEGLSNETEDITIDRGASSSQSYNVVIYFRNPGQKKGDFYSANPMFKDVSKEALEKFKKGADKAAKDDAKGAIPYFEEAIALYPQFAPAYYELGAAHLKINNTEKAIPAFVKAIEIKPDYVEAKYSLGYAQYLARNYEVAAAIFGDILQTKRDMPEVFMYLGASLLHLDQVEKAEQALKLTMGMKGGENLALAHRFMASVYQQKKKNVEAAAELEKYLQMVPKAPDADKLKQTIADLRKTT